MTCKLGGPEKISNSSRLLQTSSTEAVFDADQESDLHLEVRGRTPEHRTNFQFEAPMRRFYFFKAHYFFSFFFLLKLYVLF